MKYDSLLIKCASLPVNGIHGAKIAPSSVASVRAVVSKLGKDMGKTFIVNHQNGFVFIQRGNDPVSIEATKAAPKGAFSRKMSLAEKIKDAEDAEKLLNRDLYEIRLRLQVLRELQKEATLP